jgi:hypothetical protein
MQALLTWALHGGEGPDSRLSHFTLWEGVPVPTEQEAQWAPEPV